MLIKWPIQEDYNTKFLQVLLRSAPYSVSRQHNWASAIICLNTSFEMYIFMRFQQWGLLHREGKKKKKKHRQMVHSSPHSYWEIRGILHCLWWKPSIVPPGRCVRVKTSPKWRVPQLQHKYHPGASVKGYVKQHASKTPAAGGSRLSEQGARPGWLFPHTTEYEVTD